MEHWMMAHPALTFILGVCFCTALANIGPFVVHYHKKD